MPKWMCAATRAINDLVHTCNAVQLLASGRNRGQMNRPIHPAMTFLKQNILDFQLPPRKMNLPKYRISCTHKCAYNVLPLFRFIWLNSKISPTKIDGEWWNTFCNLQKHSINALVFLKKLCLSMH